MIYRLTIWQPQLNERDVKRDEFGIETHPKLKVIDQVKFEGHTIKGDEALFVETNRDLLKEIDQKKEQLLVKKIDYELSRKDFDGNVLFKPKIIKLEK